VFVRVVYFVHDGCGGGINTSWEGSIEVLNCELL